MASSSIFLSNDVLKFLYGMTVNLNAKIGVNEYGIPPEHILGLTFTRNAADEMRSRLVPVLGDLSTRVRLSTIHSFCLHLLKVEGRVFEILRAAGYGGAVSVELEDERFNGTEAGERDGLLRSLQFLRNA